MSSRVPNENDDKNKTKVSSVKDDASPVTPEAFALIKPHNVAETWAFGVFNSCTCDGWGQNHPDHIHPHSLSVQS